MKSFIYGFFMAWGMFLSVPCPVRIWDEKARGRMLACLPLIGGIAGGLWVLIAWLIPLIKVPKFIGTLVLAAFPFLITGFIHLDGFMDVCDAVLSRRNIEERIRILKDSHCGAFAVICVILLMLFQWAMFLSADISNISLLSLALIPVSVRACAGIAVTALKPMKSSQYAKKDANAGNASAEKPKNTLNLIILSVLLLVSAALPFIFDGLRGFAPASACCAYWLAVFLGYRQFGGISGDISGFALTIGEFAGIVVLALT